MNQTTKSSDELDREAFDIWWVSINEPGRSGVKKSAARTLFKYALEHARAQSKDEIAELREKILVLKLDMAINKAEEIIKKHGL